MLCLAADENLNSNIVCGLLRQNPDVDIVLVKDAGLSGADDPTVREWAAREKRVLLTHDVTTITHFAYERVRAGQSMAGVFEISYGLPVGRVREEILLLVECSLEGE